MSTSGKREQDALHRFVFEDHAVRGEIVRLDRTWRTVLARRRYPPRVRQVLGEALAATALLSATIKFRGQLTLQLQGQGPLHLLVVQCSDQGELRALARWHDLPEAAGLDELCGDATLTVTIEPGQGHDRYQGIVQVDGPDIAAALERYFAQSEQLPTRFKLAGNERTVAGLLLQQLPDQDRPDDDWNRIQRLGATLTAPELLALDATSILRRLFHEDSLRLFSARPLSFRCSCSRARTATMLRALGQTEVDAILAEQGQVSVACQFCGQDYLFDAVDVAQLFTASIQAEPTPTRH